MKIICIAFLTMSISLPGLSQEVQQRAIPLEPCKSRESISQDSIFVRVANELKITPEIYTVVRSTDLIYYRDSLDNAKISHHQAYSSVLYKNLDELTIESSYTDTKYNCEPIMKMYRIRKCMTCYRTLEPDEKGMYKVVFYTLY